MLFPIISINLLLFMSFFQQRIQCQSNIPSYELDALSDLYYSTNGVNWNYDESTQYNWNFTQTDPNPCVEQWEGITCITIPENSTQPYIFAISLSSTDMYGTIPPSIGNLSYLSILDVSTNNLFGTLPKELVQLQRLAVLVLDFNEFTSAIPVEFGQFNHSVLLVLSMQENMFEGTIPPQLSQLSFLQILQLSNNLLTGSIPPELGQLTLLKELVLYSNKLTGTLPPQLGEMSALLAMDVGANMNLTGTMPKELGRLNNLISLNIADNQFSGSIPPELGNCTALMSLNLESNRLNGSIPASLGNLTAMDVLSFSDNQLTGSIPPHFGNMSLLAECTLDNNLLTHTIPPELVMLQSLVVLSLDNNLLTGTIPPELFTLSQLYSIYVNNNFLSGSIPEHIGCFGDFSVDFNMLTGPIPASIGSQCLVEVFLENNQLTGRLPSFANMSRVSSFSADHNALTGAIPDSVGLTGSVLTFLYLEHNFLSQNIPDGLCDLSLAVILSLAYNLLSGPLPGTFGQMASLQSLFLSNNLLSGNLDSAFDPQAQIQLSYIDISTNQFTGNVPTSAFQLELLTSFAAVGNCISGTIPPEICTSTTLITLALDGLMSASGCQKRFFPSWTGINSYGLSEENQAGTVPSCLYSMSSLQTLHLSGNGLTGSIPTDIVLGSELLDISLSHNLMEGDIPLQLYQHTWTNLDLSFNKLRGALPDDMRSVPANASISLEVNRLSGKIPSALQRAQQISLLDGNLFQCDPSRSELPDHDSYAHIYECGSNTFNYAMYVWVAVAGSAVVLAIILVCWSTHKEVLNSIKLWLDAVNSLVDHSHLMEFGHFTFAIRWICAVISLFIIIVLMPTFAALSSLYDTYVYEYAWTVSASYLSGTTATAVMCVFFVLYGAVFVGTIRLKCYPLRMEGEKHAVKAERWSVALACKVTALVLWDLVLVTGVNIAYVYINHNYKTAIVRVTQVCVALFKVAWNGFVVQKLLQLTANDRLISGAERIALAVFVILFNNIAAPFIATAYVSSNCFYNVIVAAPSVEVSFSYPVCDEGGVTGNVTTCYGYSQSANDQTSYAPPFIYSYQCSSTFVTTYASIYVFMFTIEAFVTPALLWAMKISHTRYSTSTPDSRWCRLLGQLLPSILKPLPTVVAASSTTTQRYFACDAFIVKLVNLFAILSTFGVILPPVAAVCCVTVFCVTYHTQLLIGRLVSEAQRSSRQDVIISVDDNCSNAAEKFGSAVWIVIPFAAVFYSLFLFDTLGDAVGWREALWAPLLMCCLPIGLRIVRVVYGRFVSGNKSKNNNRSCESKEKNEGSSSVQDLGVVSAPFHNNCSDDDSEAGDVRMSSNHLASSRVQSTTSVISTLSSASTSSD